MATPRIGFIFWEEGVTQAQTVYNDLAAKTDVWLAGAVKSRATDAQPGSPAEGDAYVITAAPTGAAWAGFTQNYVAVFIDAAWVQYAPVGRAMMWVDDEAVHVFWNGSAWVDPYATAGFLSQTDIDTVAELNAIVTDGPLATQAYADALLAGLVDLKGSYDASTNTPDLDTSPSGLFKGDAYECSVAGTFFTYDLEVGDLIIAKQDSPTTEAHWIINKKSGGGAGGLTPVFVSGSHTAAASEAICALTATAAATIPITLPAGNDGDQITVDDFEDSAASYNVTITPNGAETVDGGADFTINVNGGGVKLVYQASSTDWKVAYRTPGASGLVGTQTLVLRPYDFTQVSGETTRSVVVVSGNDLDCLDMVTTSGYHWASIAMPMPKSWDGGTIRFRYAWASSNADTGDVQIGLYNGMNLVDGDDWNASGWDAGNGTAVTDNGLGAANRFHLSAWSSWANMAAIDDGLNIFRVQRNAATDTYTGTVKFLYLEMQYKTDALTDD